MHAHVRVFNLSGPLYRAKSLLVRLTRPIVAGPITLGLKYQLDRMRLFAFNTHLAHQNPSATSRHIHINNIKHTHVIKTNLPSYHTAIT